MTKHQKNINEVIIMANKITNVSVLTDALDILKDIEAFDAEKLEKLKSIKASYERKNNGERKPSATQKENEALRPQILAAMDIGKEYTVTEIMGLFGGKYSNQKLTRVIQPMVDGITLMNSVSTKGRSVYVRLA